MSKMIIKIPIKANKNKYSAMVSSFIPLVRLFIVLIEIKENIQEKVSKTATIEVNSSILCVSFLLLM